MDKKTYEQKSKKWADTIGSITIQLSLDDVLEGNDSSKIEIDDFVSTLGKFDEQQEMVLKKKKDN